MTRISLPIDPRLSEIQRAVSQKASLVITATPGSGKTTRVPHGLLSVIPQNQKIYVLEPRRLAARLSAERVAEENNLKLGQDVGYQFRFEKKREASTRLVFLTEGMLMRELLSNPDLQGVGCVVLDEFHERHLQGDLMISVLKRLKEASRPDIKIVVMSATLEVEPLLAYLPDPVHIDITGAPHPIDIRYVTFQANLEQQVKNAVTKLLAEPDAKSFGDILVFLPGMSEIRRTEETLKNIKEIDVTPLHGELSKEEQERALRPSQRTKVILATNIAESSLTIPGVSQVIDAGLSRVASYSHWSGLPALKTKPISRASAIQRAGRAGRTRSGKVVRLYSKGDFEGRMFADLPEVKRVDLSQSCLELMNLGVQDFGSFPWFESPSKEVLKSTLMALWRLGAVTLDSSKELMALPTRLGNRLTEVPLHPRLSRVLVEAESQGIFDAALDLIVALSEGHDLGIDALEGRLKVSQDANFNRVRERIARSLKTPVAVSSAGKMNSTEMESRLSWSLLTGFSDRVAMKRGSELVFSQGGSAAFDPAPVFQSHDFFLVIDVQETQRQGEIRSRVRVKSVCAIESEDLLGLEPQQIEEKNEVVWNEQKNRFMLLEEMRYQQLVLSSKIKEAPIDSPEIRDQVLPALLDAWLKNITQSAETKENFASFEIRYRHVYEAEPTKFEARTFRECLKQNLEKNWSGEMSLKDLPDFDTAVASWIPRETLMFMDRLVPAFVDLAHRKRVRVNYVDGQPPYVESRLQDFFGMKEGPTWMGGRKKLALHLLAPNYRAVQVTEDLQGFWDRHYPTIRKELMRRYPRHKWPENPV